jgi:hypothetical protein
VGIDGFVAAASPDSSATVVASLPLPQEAQKKRAISDASAVPVRSETMRYIL